MIFGVVTVPGTGFEVPSDALLGLVTGLTYSLLAMGLVLIYRTNRVFNFAHGEMGALVALLVPYFVISRGVPYWLAFAVALASGAAVGALVEVGVMRRLVRAPRLLVLVATIGLAQLISLLAAYIPREGLGQSTYPIPFDVRWRIGSVVLHTGHLMILVGVPLLTAALTLFLQRSRLGLASRAVADNDEVALLNGISVHRVSLAIWMIAGLFAGASAILVGPTRPVLTEIATGPGLILRGLAAAVIGGLVSLPMAFVGGIVIGLMEFLVLWNYPTGGVFEVSLFLTVLGVMLVHPRLRVAARALEDSSWSLGGGAGRLDARIRAHPLVRWLTASGWIALFASAYGVPMLVSNSHRVLLSSIVLFALIGCSLVVLTGYAGQISLGQFGFVAVGAFVGGRMNQLGYPPPLALLWACVAGGVVAALVGLPALRIRGLYLAVTTLGFAVAGVPWFLRQGWLVTLDERGSSLQIPRPDILGVDFDNELTYYWLCLTVLVAVGFCVSHLARTGLGRSMMAVRDNAAEAATLSVNPSRTKMLAFALSGVIASMGGYFYGGLLVRFGEGAQEIFAAEVSLVVVAMVIFGGVTTVAGAVLGALWLRGLDYFTAPLVGDVAGPRFAILLSGVGLLGAVLQYPQGLACAVLDWRDKWLVRLTRLPTRELQVSARASGASRERLPAMPVTSPVEPGPPALEAVDVVVAFGGIHAVDHVSVHAERGEIVGLVGPNGAGKTTLFDVLSGQLRPDGGTVLLDGVEVTRRSPAERARLGMGRTFQQARLFDELSLADSLKVALECVEPSEPVPALLALPPSRAAERAKQRRVEELLELLGLEGYANTAVRELSTGTRRIAQLACVIAMGSHVLLLDEPTAGVAQREVEAFGAVLREVRDHLGATMVVIDHDIPTLVDLSDRLYVLSAGRLIAEGDPHEVREDPAVITAYLGTDERVIARSGPQARR